MTKERDSAVSDKAQISFNLSLRGLAWLRHRSEEAETSLNEALRSVLRDYFDWYQLPEPVMEVLRADAKKRSRDDQRAYVIDLLMKRYTELMFEQQHQAEKKK